MKTPVAVTQSSEDVERRTRRVPWGVQIEVWQRTNTITIPESAAGAMVVSSLLEPLPTEPPASPAAEFDDETLDTPAESPKGWDSIPPDDEPVDPALIRSPDPEWQP